MGFPVGCPELILPRSFLLALHLLGFIRSLVSAILALLGLADLLDSPDAWPETAVPYPAVPDRRASVPASAVVIRELLPAVKFGGGDAAERCAVCLYEFWGGEEIRRLANCGHIFHRECVDRWMDHDQMTCPLCRTQLVPAAMRDEFRRRLCVAAYEPSAHFALVPGDL